MSLSPCPCWSHSLACLSYWLRRLSSTYILSSNLCSPGRDCIPLVITLSSPLAHTVIISYFQLTLSSVCSEMFIMSLPDCQILTLLSHECLSLLGVSAPRFGYLSPVP